MWVCVCVCFAFFLNRKLIPEDTLSCENVLYWRGLCEFFKAKGDDGEEMLERVLPDAATYADYLNGWDICLKMTDLYVWKMTSSSQWANSCNYSSKVCTVHKHQQLKKWATKLKCVGINCVGCLVMKEQPTEDSCHNMHVVTQVSHSRTGYDRGAPSVCNCVGNSTGLFSA